MNEQEVEGRAIMSAEVNVSLEQMRDWPPALIRVFFDGIAQAVHAASLQRESVAPTPESAVAGVPPTREASE